MCPRRLNRFYYYGVKLILTHPKSTLRHSSKILKRSILRRNQSEEGGGAWRTWRIARKFVKWIYPGKVADERRNANI